MPPKVQDIESLLTSNLGKEAADAVLAKIETMARAGATAAAIEKAVQTDLQAHIEQAVVTSVVAKIGPIQPIKVKPIQVSIKPAIKPIVVSPKINTGVSIKVGPGPLTRGSK